LQRKTVGIVRGKQPSQIRHIFAERLAPIDREIRERAVLVKLRRKRFAGGLETFEVSFGKPVHQPAARVKLTSHVIKAMADFVADNNSLRSVITRRIAMGLKKRRLQPRCRKVQSVLQRKIDSVDGLWRHPPFIGIDRLPQLCDLGLISKQTRSFRVSGRVTPNDPQTGKIPPAVRVSDSHA